MERPGRGIASIALCLCPLGDNGYVQPISALPPKADIVQHNRDVRFVPIADSCGAAKLLDAQKVWN
jgi:hypothetical protein